MRSWYRLRAPLQTRHCSRAFPAVPRMAAMKAAIIVLEFDMVSVRTDLREEPRSEAGLGRHPAAPDRQTTACIL